METLFFFLKTVPILFAAVILGNWFLSEVKKTRTSGAPWYRPYFSIPGILIIIVILIPVFISVLKD